MSESSKIKVGISVGDPNGIGFEIILKTFQEKNLFKKFIPIAFAHPQNFFEESEKYKLDTNIIEVKNIGDIQENFLNVIDIWDNPFPINYGKDELTAGNFAFSSLEAATTALIKNKIDVLVTAPINKKNIQSKRFQFKGHTDYLDKEINGESLMFMISDQIKLALVTDHIPLAKVNEFATKNTIIKKIKILEHSLKSDFNISEPKIAILGINPHAGDYGVIGEEEETFLRPLVKAQFDKGIRIDGPFPADGFFGSQSYQKFDAILAIYHDQGLIPFKTLSFGEGVNFTAGLDRVRTSPDHGTAYDIAGQGEADHNSFKKALHTAREIFLNRKKFNDAVNQN